MQQKYPSISLSFSELLEALSAIDTKILSTKLKQLVENQILQREIDEENPKKVYYSLTDKGQDLRDTMESMAEWAYNWD